GRARWRSERRDATDTLRGALAETRRFGRPHDRELGDGRTVLALRAHFERQPLWQHDADLALDRLCRGDDDARERGAPADRNELELDEAVDGVGGTIHQQGRATTCVDARGPRHLDAIRQALPEADLRLRNGIVVLVDDDDPHLPFRP